MHSGDKADILAVEFLEDYLWSGQPASQISHSPRPPPVFVNVQRLG